jgi:hypothetical protein
MNPVLGLLQSGESPDFEGAALNLCWVGIASGGANPACRALPFSLCIYTVTNPHQIFKSGKLCPYV